MKVGVANFPQNCKPCADRSRRTEATRTVAGEPWCDKCFRGGELVRRISLLGPKPFRASLPSCKNPDCSSKVYLSRSTTGYCYNCSLKMVDKPAREMRPCKSKNCDGTVTPRCRHGYCRRCREQNTDVRAEIYPSQRRDVASKRVMRRYYERKQELSNRRSA